MTYDYKFFADDLDKNIKEAVPSGENVLQTLIDRTCKLLNGQRSSYLQFGVYWFAIKAVLKQHSRYSYGDFSSEYLEKEYSTAFDSNNEPIHATPEQIIIAGWTFSQVESNAFHPRDSWEIDGDIWDVTDEDMMQSF